MVKRLAFALLCLSAAARGETFRLFGSGGGESQLAKANEASPLNPGNLVGIRERSSSADLSAFFDIAPDSRRFKVHMKLRGESVERSGSHAEVGEAFLQLNVTPAMDIVVGRAIEKWGTGYAWNPTAFISPKKNPADSTDRRSSYRGLEMIKSDIFVRGTNLSLYALERGTYAARAYRLVKGIDLSVYMRHDRQHTNTGVSAARVFGDALELHGELAQKHALIGGQYTFRTNVNVVVEAYHGGDGMSGEQWRAFGSDVEAAEGKPLALLQSNRRYTPLMMGQNYAFARFDWPSTGRENEVEMIAIGNLRDRSGIARLTLTHKIRPDLAVYLIETEFFGANDSEFAYIQVKRLTTIGVRWYF